MAFEKRINLDCEVATALGGVDKKSGKKNPTQVEGYFIGSKEIPDKFSKTGTGFIHIFQTPKGRVGVFGKTDSNRQMKDAPVGTMMRITYTGTRDTKYGPMAKFDVEVDKSKTIEVDFSNTSSNTNEDGLDQIEADDYDGDETTEEEALDEVTPPRTSKPTNAAATPDAARQARVQALLSAGKTRT